MKENFNKSLTFVLKEEGGNNKQDHGGKTSRGITQKEYTYWCAEHRLPDRDVWEAPQSEIVTIYHDEYWNPYCDSLPAGTDYLYFDMAVNAGPQRATILLQRALGLVADGRIGRVTRMAIISADVKTLVKNYTDQKRAFYLSLHQPKFIKGWLNRCDHVAANALTFI